MPVLLTVSRLSTGPRSKTPAVGQGPYHLLVKVTTCDPPPRIAKPSAARQHPARHPQTDPLPN